MDKLYIQYIIPALLALAAALLSALTTGGITLFIGNRTIIKQQQSNNKMLSLQHITDKRVDWIYTVRDELSNYISYGFWAAEEYKIHKPEKRIPSDVYGELNKHTAKLKLLFNFNGKIDRVILHLIDEITDNLSSEKFRTDEFLNNMNLLTEHSQVYLKLEWDRVKLETTQNYDDDTLKKILYERAITLYDGYKNQEKCEDCSLEFLPKVSIDKDYTL